MIDSIILDLYGYDSMQYTEYNAEEKDITDFLTSAH
jgi:hypothetical protein